MNNLQALHKLLVDFNVSINQSTDIVAIAAINDQLIYAKQNAETRLLELNKRIDIAFRTYVRWKEKKDILSDLLNELLKSGSVPNRQEFIRINGLLQSVITQFDQLPTVYGEDWKLFGIREGNFLSTQLEISTNIQKLKDRLNKIGIEYFPDLMF